MQQHTYGTTPDDVIEAAVRAQCPCGYPIEAHEGSNDFRALQSAVNQGIDAHLTAVNFTEFRGAYGKRGFTFDAPSIAVLCRRLYDEGTEATDGLRTAILGALGIEEV